MNINPIPEDIIDLIFYANRALQGEVRQILRQASIEYFDDKVILYLFYERSLTQQEIDDDIAGIILTEIISDLSKVYKCGERNIVIPYPNQLPSIGICIYRRYEPIHENITRIDIIPTEIYAGNIIVVLNQALLGYIHTNMRQIDLSYDDEQHKAQLYVYFDTAATKQQLDDIQTVLSYTKSKFSSDISWQVHNILLPYPNRTPHEGVCVFSRYEVNPESIEENN